MNENVSAFLQYGYLPQRGGTISSLPFDIDILRSTHTISDKNSSEDYLIEKGAELLHNALTSSIASGSNKHVVPLSGGLDSRAILGALLDRGLGEQIVTVTFGTPGTYDYDIGNLIGESISVKHKSINLNNVKVEQEVLYKTIQNGTDWTFLFDAFYNSIIRKEFGKDCVYWSGFMGGELAGSHLTKKPVTNFKRAKEIFADKNALPNANIYKHPEFDRVSVLPEKPLIDRDVLSYLEQLDFSIRQTQYIQPTVITSNFEYQAPFLTEEWIQFILGVPRQYRIGMKLYKQILRRLWPDLFNLPTETNYGLPLTATDHQIFFRKLLRAGLSQARRFFPWFPWPPRRSTNYIDFDEAIRFREDYQTLVRNSLTNLNQRPIADWIDNDSLWRIHQSKNRDLAYPLLLLTALDLNLRVEGR
ncbi:hypothetical protein ACLI4Q_06400 [Natrialbaceae archaeon A-CW1-1]